MLLSGYFITIINYLGLQSPLGPQLDVPAPIEGHVKPHPEQFEPWVPPGAMPDPGDPNSVPIKCDYTAMVADGYLPSRPDGNSEWIPHKDDPNLHYNITTDYDARTPIGTTREYNITVTESDVQVWDGREIRSRPLADGRYPGPWIQACWGDTVKITVHNNLTEVKNGTAIHFHGLRLLNSNLVDGVPGVTQCPIAPGQNYTYIFNATQYGTSWYHSHYSLQYSDGLLGPLTIHGPTSAEYDEPLYPLVMSDHNQRTAFQEYYMEQYGPPFPNQESILINNHGSFAGQFPQNQYTQTVQKGKKYSLMLINAATDTTFVFGIDGHTVTVIGTDLVAVQPFETNHVRLGNGQRYHVILEAKEDVPDGSSFWIRTYPAEGCNGFRPRPPDARQGILWYSSGNETSPPVPETSPMNYTIECKDMVHYEPVVKRTVPAIPQLGDGSVYDITDTTISVWQWNLTKDTNSAPDDKVWSWKILKDHARVDYKKPSVDHVDELEPGTWDHTAVIDSKPMKDGEDVWNYMLIVGGRAEKQVGGGMLVPAYHPIHLHGHDFVVLKNSSDPYQGYGSLDDLQLDNPMRRDTVLLPNNGYLVIAWKSDNPGVWALHCHIAWHASAGLALQIVEGREELNKQLDLENISNLSPDEAFLAQQYKDTCRSWSIWQDNRIGELNDANSTERFQDDSGI
ncbi:multicopper oxidase-domain-containing protein [Aspergillus candidus]|uniref:Multicopper oxidase-domain-containing protein n=1 Tax=Aspergillus candidus TaxID=41067 RepID=A0A2I2F7N0_ASPCN|nr:multicopper oxidase-domain-containing protein [Aspergillus candidus]PLB36637.1 multicopper oxidase-domain-containing protein [Aspergillus candidus]